MMKPSKNAYMYLQMPYMLHGLQLPRVNSPSIFKSGPKILNLEKKNRTSECEMIVGTSEC